MPVVMRFVVLVSVASAAVLCLHSTARAEDEKPPVIKPEEARKHVGKKVSVTFEVKKTKHAAKRKKYYLDALEDFRDEKNLGIQIEEPVAERLREKKQVDDPVTYYKDKTIKVVGTVFLEDDLPYIRIEDPDQIDVVKKD